MSLLVPIEAFDNFTTVKDFPITGFATDVLLDLIQRVKELDEREEFEPWLRSILADGAQTPHGPAEIVDIFTHHITANGRHGMAAFILKGKSFSTVKPVDVAHQIYRLKKIEGLKFAVFAAPGTILDAAKEGEFDLDLDDSSLAPAPLPASPPGSKKRPGVKPPDGLRSFNTISRLKV